MLWMPEELKALVGGGESGDSNQGGRSRYPWIYKKPLALITVTAVKLRSAARGA